MKVKFSELEDEFNYINELELDQIPRIGDTIYLIDRRYCFEDDIDHISEYFAGQVKNIIWFLINPINLFVEIILEK